MTLDAWVDYIQQFHSAEIDMGLSRLERVAERLALNIQVPIITVAGTNGKGSTIKLLQRICQAHGLKPCVYTSPHIHVFNERIVLGDEYVTDETLISAFEVIDAARQAGEVIPLTFFEFTTLAAFVIFQQTVDADVCILEVGLGGRLDATNIVSPDIAVVTSIGLDHQEYLGDTREAIGCEKIGIARANKPLVMGDANCPQLVLDAAVEMGAQLYQQGVDFAVATQEVSTEASDAAGQTIAVTTHLGEHKTYALPNAQLPWVNVATALQALHLLRDDWSAESIAQAVSQAQLPGRCQRVVYREHVVTLDVGHNPAAIEMLIQQANFKPASLTVVFAMLADKAVTEVITLLKPYVKQWLVADVDTPRNMGKAVIAQALAKAGVDAVSVYESPEQAFDAATACDAPVLVTGSFYTVAAVLKHIDSVA